jgi:hypothetical protein
VDIDGVEGDATKWKILGCSFGHFYIHGEVKFSLWVDGEIAEMVKFPAPGPFEAVALDECGTISISYMNFIWLFLIHL